MHRHCVWPRPLSCHRASGLSLVLTSMPEPSAAVLLPSSARSIVGANGLGAGLGFTNTRVQNVPSAFVSLDLTVAEPPLPI